MKKRGFAGLGLLLMFVSAVATTCLMIQFAQADSPFKQKSGPFGSLPPAPPSNLSIKPYEPWIRGEGGIFLGWHDNSNNEQGFKIERRIGNGKYELVAQPGPDIHVWGFSGLSPSTTYYFRVKAFNQFGDSAYSNENSITLPDKPAAPTNLEVKVPFSASAQIVLSWKDNSNNEEGFEIGQRIGQTIVPLARVGKNVTSYIPEGLEPNHTYCYVVRAYNMFYSDSAKPEVVCGTTVVYPMTQAFELISPKNEQVFTGDVTVHVKLHKDINADKVTLKWKWVPPTKPGDWVPEFVEKNILPEIPVKNHEAYAVIPQAKFDTMGRWWLSIAVNWPPDNSTFVQVYFKLIPPVPSMKKK